MKMSSKFIYFKFPEDVGYHRDEYLFESDDFNSVTDEEITGQSRWSTFYYQVFKYKDGTFWGATWNRGSTEQQDNGIEDLKVFQVEPEQVLITKYKAIEKEDK